MPFRRPPVPAARRRSLRRFVPAAIACVAAAAVPVGMATAADEPAPLLGINVDDAHINFLALAPEGSLVRFQETTGGQTVELGEATAVDPKGTGPTGAASIPAIPWRCDRTLRQFRADIQTLDGRKLEAVNEARTPSCANRLLVSAPARINPGSRLKVVVKDRWRVGDMNVRVCLAQKGAKRYCKVLKFAPGVTAMKVQRTLGRRKGVLDVETKLAGLRTKRQVGVGVKLPRRVLPKMVVTGDSQIQGIDAELAEIFSKRYRVVRETRPGTGVSKDLGESWMATARRQVKNHKPTVTIVFLGGNDGFEMKTPGGGKVACCEQPWRDEYLRRIQDMAETYSRGDRGRVIWATIPPGKTDDQKQVIDLVNNAILRMAARVPTVTLVRFDQIFGPEYKTKINGVEVRDPDGLHLSPAGEKIAAREFAKAERRSASSVNDG